MLLVLFLELPKIINQLIPLVGGEGLDEVHPLLSLSQLSTKVLLLGFLFDFLVALQPLSEAWIFSIQK